MISGYKKIFWGMFFTMFHFNFGPIQIIPNFVGILIVSSGIKEVLDEYDNSNLTIALKINNIQALISFIIFILPFVGIENLFSNAIISIVWFNIVCILEILSILKLLEGTSEVLGENFNNYLSDIYRNKAIKYIYLYSLVLIISNFNFIFMSELTTIIIGIYGFIIKIWVVVSFKKLYTGELQID